MSTGERVSLDDVTRALIADGITDPAVLRTAVAIAARESGLGQGGYVESDLPETPGSALTWLDRYDPNAVGHGVFQFTPGKDWATAPMHPNMDGWTLQQQVDYFAKNYAANRDFSPWTYNPTYAQQVTDPNSGFVKSADASLQRVFSGQGSPPQAQSTAAIADRANQVLQGVPASASASPPPASPVAPLPPQGNAPMAGPQNAQTDFQKALAAGLQIETKGIYSTYVTDENGNEVQVFFRPDGSNWVAFPYGSPEGQNQYNSLQAEYRASGAPSTGGLPVQQGTTQSGNPFITIASGAQTQYPASGTTSAGPSTAPTSTGLANAGATAGAGGFRSPSTTPPPNQAGAPPATSASGTAGAVERTGPPPREVSVPGTLPGTGGHAIGGDPRDVALATQGGLIPQQVAPPRPSGFIPTTAIPGQTGNAQADVVGNFLRSNVQTDANGKVLGSPFYASDNPQMAENIRRGGYPVLVSNSPGSVSIASPAGGIGFNPLAIQDAERGLSSFGIPPEGASLSQSQVAALQDNPYSANNPLEQARLSGGLVKDLQYVSNGNGQTTAHYATGVGGLTISRPATIIDNATGQPLATIVDSRNQTPETLYDHGGSISIMNHAARTMMPDNPYTGMIRRFDVGGGIDSAFEGAQGGLGGVPTNPAAQPQPAQQTQTSSGVAGVQPPPPIASAAPVASATPASTTIGGLSIPSIPTAPTAPSLATANLSSGVAVPGAQPDPLGVKPIPTLTNAEAYDQAYNNYQAQLAGIGGAFGQQRLDALSKLDSPASDAERQAVAAAQRTQDTTDYKYGAAGLPKPIDVLPAIGQNGMTGGSLGPGLRWALLTPEQQYERMNSQLSSASSALSDLVQAARAKAEADRQNFLAAYSNASGGGGSSKGGSGGGFTGTNPYASNMGGLKVA